MKQYVVDVFTKELFKGNPAAVCVMDQWISEDLMLNIARENNLSETAFAVKEGDHYKLRWFTIAGEIDLCGHATLATGFVILNYIETDMSEVSFETMSGGLKVEKEGKLFEMDLPSFNLKKTEVTSEMTQALGVKPLEAYLGRDLLCVLETEEQVRNLKPDMNKVLTLPGSLQNVTAPGKEFDCVSRTFSPKFDDDEDPVCGSGHCHIVPYWAQRLNKNKIVAYQASERGGILYCDYQGERLKIAGNVVLYSIAELMI